MCNVRTESITKWRNKVNSKQVRNTEREISNEYKREEDEFTTYMDFVLTYIAGGLIFYETCLTFVCTRTNFSVDARSTRVHFPTSNQLEEMERGCYGLRTV